MIAPPRTRLLDKVPGHTVYEVDGQHIRKNIDPEFTNWATNDNSKHVPKGEIWVDKSAATDEHQHYVTNALALRRFRAKGHPYEKARELADAVESRERNKEQPGMKGSRVGVYKSLYKSSPGKPRVWVVHGNLVRKNLKTDFTEGGHGLVYPFIPKGEVWLDDDTDPSEIKNILVHELHERNLMAGGAKYEGAHKKADKIEAMTRDHPQMTDAVLNGEYNKSEAKPKVKK